MFSSKNQFLTGAGGYQISRSVRLRSSASAYLSKTPTVSGNTTTFTYSVWAKRGSLSSNQYLFWGGNNCTFGFGVVGTDELGGNLRGTGATNYFWNTSGVFRDPSAWYHIVWAVDTTQATDTNRLKVYVNGVQQTLSATYCPQNTAQLSTAQRNIGSESGRYYYDGYLTEINFIDGQALTPSSFGQNDPGTGVWEPIKYAGTYGTNGFYLNFSDNSAATAAAIGKDNSGNGNNWTPNNISVTAGVTYDSMLDVPTPWGDRGNYAVLNAVNKNSNTTLSAGNLDIKSTTTGWSDATGTIGVSSGKWYWEVTVVSGVGGAEEARCGILKDGFALPSIGGYNAGSYVYSNNGNKYNNSTGVAYGATFTNGDIIGVALDLDAGTLAFYKNNTSQGTAYSGLSGVYFPEIAQSTVPVQSANFGQRPFSYTPPTGFVALNTQNLPTPTISNGATVMAATLWTGNGTSQSISNAVNGISFQPDMVWVKDRSAARSHVLIDAVRGTGLTLFPNETTADQSNTDRITSFNSNGFSVGAGLATNANTETYVGWQWNAGGSTVTNTSGTISAQVRANATAGFSVVTYTGTGANATVGHGLGVAPKMIFVKKRSAIQAWSVYHASLANTQYLVLNTTAAVATLATMWNSTSPTSTVFSIGTDGNVNASTATYVAYCFSAVAGYSAFGSYTGNGSTDGPFVYCGFRPKLVMYKRTDTTGNWIIYDSSRSTYNQPAAALYPNLSNAEDVSHPSDFLSNGFKLRSTGLDSNASGGTFIFAAFAENPFKISLAR